MKNLIKKIKETKISYWFLGITAYYFVGAFMQNLLSVKTLGNSAMAIVTAGTLISWSVFGAIDIITEVWGKKVAIRTFWTSAILNLIFTGICWIAILIPGTNDFVGSAYAVILGTGWRIAICSMLAFILSNYTNTLIMHVMKSKSKNKKDGKEFSLRLVLSTLAGQIIDNALFFTLAFAPFGIAGTIEMSWIFILEVVAFTTTIEVIVEGAFSPLFHKFTLYLESKKNLEGDK